MMERLIEKYHKKLSNTSLTFVRSFIDQINWNARMIGIKGARGVGKTTLLLQYIRINYDFDPSVLYVSLDDIWFSENLLSALADKFVKQGGKVLLLDEVHKYPGWSRELKNIYDDLPELKIIFTGSSLMEINKAGADLSRRAIIYTMQGLSFREYLNFESNLNLNIIPLSEIISNHIRLSREIVKQIKPLKYFSSYISQGYYPYYKDVPELYFIRLGEVINMILETELPLVKKVEPIHVNRLKQMLYMISESAPFVPNISKLSERAGINRNTFVLYLNYLQEAGILTNLYRNARGITRLQKPEKIFLENSNIAFAIKPVQPDQGNMRETFFANQVSFKHKITYPEQGDFLVDDTFLFEIGGMTKNNRQLRNLPNSYIAADDLEFGHQNKIPLWLFGFLY